MKATLTIFTPAYNRAYTLHKCYESLKKQTNKDFEWLIIDDGSTDNTKELVQSWIEENLIPIKYHYQKNQGMHGAHNSAYELIDTTLNVCIDSDDYMPDDAVEKILKFWEENQSEEIAGIAALDAYESGEVIGTTFPKDLKTSTSFDMYYKHGVCGDKKFIYKKTGKDLSKDIDFLLNMYCRGSVDMTVDWVLNDMPIKKEEIVQYLMDAIPDKLEAYMI